MNDYLKLIVAISALPLSISACASKEKALAQDVMEAIADWSQCRAQFVMPKVKSDQSAEALVDGALKECKGDEDRVMSLGIRHYGQSWRASVKEFRMQYRADIIKRVTEMRLGKPPSNPWELWGICTSQQLAVEKQSQEASDVVAERIMISCKSYEAAILSDAERELGKKQAAEVLESSHATVRKMLIDKLNLLKGQSAGK